MTNKSVVDQSSLEELKAKVGGPVYGPEEPGYREACASWNLAWSHCPAAVVHSASERDVIAAVKFATSRNLGVVVQATGHGVAVPADEHALLIVTAAMDGVTVDPATATATVQGGATWATVLSEAQKYGLAPLLGSSPNVGAVGYTLGGGMGWLARQHGLAVDSVLSLRAVLADGRLVTASPSEEPELFWALCGAGAGTLCVVVEMKIALVPMGDVYGGNLFYPSESAGEVFEFYREWAERQGPEMSAAFAMMAFPPLDSVPEPVRGRSFAIIRGCFSGTDLDRGVSSIDEWRRWREPALDAWSKFPFARCSEISQDPVDPMPAVSSGRWLRHIDEEVLAAMLVAVDSRGGRSPLVMAELRMGGGAIGRSNSGACFAARNGDHILALVGVIDDADAEEEASARISETWRRLDSVLADLHGFTSFNEGQERVEAFRNSFLHPDLSRLQDVKRSFDPTNVFRYAIPLGASSPASQRTD